MPSFVIGLRPCAHLIRPVFIRAVLFAAFGAANVVPVYGINIILNFESGKNDFTSVDPGAVELQRIMSFVENYWEDIFEDSHTVTINYWYEEMSSLGLHSLVSQSGGRETEADVTFDVSDSGVERPWWFDPTPSDNSEFDVQQILWRDLTATQQSDWYNDFVATNVPATFETGFAGNAPAGSPAVNMWDMVTSAIHEVGHALGLSGANNSAVTETSDDDYDFNPDFIFGQTLAVETDNDPDEPGDDNNLDKGHLENPNALLAGGQAAMGRRRLPSHTDMFAQAQSHNYLDLDVPRREFYGNTNWNNDGNWSGNRFPGAADEVYVRDAQGSGVTLTARLTADGIAGSLNVSEGANVDTDGFKLDVTGDVTVSDLDTDIFIDPGGELEANAVFIQDEAEIEMSGGVLDAGVIRIKPAGQLQSVSGAVATVMVSQLLINNGQIEADGDSNLFLSSTAAFPWDLDGDTDAQDGIVDASDGNITILSGSIAEPFDGMMIVGQGHFILIFSPWVNSSGTLDLNGGSTFETRARIDGLATGTINMTGGEISVSGIAHIDAPITVLGGLFVNPTITLGVSDTLEFNDPATVAGGTWTLGDESNVIFNEDTTVNGGTFNTFSNLAADGLVTFSGDTTYNASNLNINGIARQEGNATVDNPTVIDANVFDMDGTGVVADHNWTLNDSLTINADNIDINGNTFNSDFTINSSTALVPGKLTINLPGDDEWRLGTDGNLNQTGQTNVFSVTVDGSDFNLHGTATVTNNVAWEARADIAGDVVINANSGLRILGGSIADPYRLEGGVISGAGTLSTIGDRALVGHGTISTEIDFFNEAELRADDGELVISGQLNDVGVIGTADVDGTLRVTNAWATNVAELVELRGGIIQGAAITNQGSGSIRGFGTIAPSDLNNNSTIAAENGTLHIDPANTPDLDGTNEDGVIEAINGDLTVIDQIVEMFDGEASVGPDGTMTFHAGWRLGAGGELNLDGGTEPLSFASVAGSQQILFGSVNVNEETLFDIPTTFRGSASVSLPDASDALRLYEPSNVDAGATFTGAGVFANVSGNILTLENGASVGVMLLNAGTLEIGASTGTAGAHSLNQTALGTLHIELEGTTPGSEYDRLAVANEAILDGALEVSLLSGFAPALGNTFDIVAAMGGLTGSFSSLLLPTLAGGLFWEVHQGANVLSLIVVDAVPGDYNGDGAVDAADYIVWRKTLGQQGADLAADGNRNNRVDAGDYAIWRAHFGLLESGAAAAAVPEPSAVPSLALVAVMSLFSRRRRPTSQACV